MRDQCYEQSRFRLVAVMRLVMEEEGGFVLDLTVHGRVHSALLHSARVKRAAGCTSRAKKGPEIFSEG